MLRTWKIRDGDDGRSGAFQFERLAVRVTRWRVILVGIGAAAYALGLVAMLPAEVVTPDDRDAVGTVWRGQVGLPGGFVAGWVTLPLQSVARFGLAERVRVAGPQTALEGQATLRPGSVIIRDLEGVASARLLSAVAPGLPFTCDADLRVAVAELAIQGGPAGEGAIRSGPGACLAGGGATSPLPGLTGTFGADDQATTLTLTRDGSADALARARVAPNGAVSLAVEPGGVGVLPGITAPVAIETTL